jgi:hypothetical protein
MAFEPPDQAAAAQENDMAAQPLIAPTASEGTVRTNRPPSQAATQPTAELAAEAPKPRVGRLAKAIDDAKAARSKAATTQDSPRRATASHKAPAAKKRASTRKAESKPSGAIDRVPPSELLALLAEHGINRSQLAKALGVTTSRISEMTTDRRPKSHVARSRWPEVVKAAKAAAKAPR